MEAMETHASLPFSLTASRPLSAILCLMPQGFSLAHFEAVLFDVDGTLVDSLEMIIPGLGDAIEKYAGIRPSDDEIKGLIGLPMRARLEGYLSYSPTEHELSEMIDFTLARFDAYVSREKVFEAAIDTLNLCKSVGVRTALVTSKDSKEMALFMKRFPGADAVDVTVCSSDVKRPKPAPDSSLLALSRLGVSKGSAVLIGDSIYDMRCARSAGIAHVAVGYGSATPEALLAEQPDLYLDTPDALLAWARQSFLNRNGPQESTNRRFIDPDDLERKTGAA
jgi:pyrophosphatase PpaX